MKLRELQNKIKSIDMQTLKEQAVKDYADEIVKLNQMQLKLGRTKDGKYISPSYSKAYLKRKRKLSSYVAPDGIPDLFLHGDFYREMETIIEDNQYDVISWDEKSQWLLPKYDDIFGLTKENIEKIKPLVTNRLIELLKNKLN